MIKLFKYFKEMHELKKMKLQYEVLILGRIHSATKVLDNIPLLLQVANKVKDMNPTDAQKEIINSIVDFIKKNQENQENTDEETGEK